jgi:Cys-tRNA synthase (O-phospho-L-seryl-tRNA:Cys-tRNA synthase)
LALDGHTQTPSLAVLLRVTEKYSESADAREDLADVADDGGVDAILNR